jgi:hypothetical protein
VFAYPQTKLRRLAVVAFCFATAGSELRAQSPPCVTLTQTVLDEQSRVPLVSARVTASWQGVQQRDLRTDSLGRATLCLVPQQTTLIRITYLDRNTSWQIVPSEGKPIQQTSVLDVQSTSVRGRVVEDQSGTGIANAHVRLANTSLQTVSDGNGRFAFERVPAGSYMMQVQHIGYTGHRGKLDVGDEDLDAVIRVAPAVIPLQPIVVTAFSRRLEAVGFYERRKRGIGTFIDRKRVDAMNVQAASDLLRHLPGVRLVPQSRTRQNQPQNATVGRRGNCRYVFIIDGARTLADFEMDYISGSAIEGVEVYNGISDVPAPFKAHTTSVAGSSVCGVVAIWSRNSR